MSRVYYSNKLLVMSKERSMCCLCYAKGTCFDHASKNVDYATVGNIIHEHMTCKCLYEHKSLHFCRIFYSSMIYQSLMALINSVLCSDSQSRTFTCHSQTARAHGNTGIIKWLHYLSINPLMLDKCTHHQA